MTVRVDRSKCGYCGACVSVCPTASLELVETWIEVGEDCAGCNACVKLCPMGALEASD